MIPCGTCGTRRTKALVRKVRRAVGLAATHRHTPQILTVSKFLLKAKVAQRNDRTTTGYVVPTIVKDIANLQRLCR